LYARRSNTCPSPLIFKKTPSCGRYLRRVGKKAGKRGDKRAGKKGGKRKRLFC
jgi:hypothetical protein